MPSLRKSNPVIAVACSDLHLSENAPTARACEPDWFDCQRRPLEEVAALAKEYDCPILFAGDLFDKWDVRPPLINFALDALPEMYAIPGNHDAPFHNLDLIGQSAYWTMVSAKRIFEATAIDGFAGWDVTAFPFGAEVHQPTNDLGGLQVALIHAYAYAGVGTHHERAPGEAQIQNFNLDGYQAAFFGDNHINWAATVGETNVMNCGTMIRRKANEIAYRPACGLLRANRTIETYYFDCTQDKFIDDAEKLMQAEIATGIDLSGFADELRGLAAAGLDFRDALIRRCEDQRIGKDVKKIILKAAGL
jgi:predicted phosphodiesterase